MGYEADIGALKSEIERIKESLIRSEKNFDKKSKNLHFQLTVLQKAVEIMKKGT